MMMIMKMCVCMWERGREGENEGEKEGEKEKDREGKRVRSKQTESSEKRCTPGTH